MSEHDYGRTLYPFLYDAPRDATAMAQLLDEARRSTLQKCDDVIRLRASILDRSSDAILAAAAAMAERFTRGGKLLTFGNGGSATDAHDAALDCQLPPFPSWRPLPALALSTESAVLTAIANDVGLERVFSRQVIAFGDDGDIALGFSTSGNSRDVLEGLVEARKRGLLVIGIAGNDGGAMARTGTVDHCLVAPAEHIPRIQEGHATIWHALLELVHATLGEAHP